LYEVERQHRPWI